MNRNSKELFINMKPSDIPYWNPVYTFDEQDDDVKQFWTEEFIKLMDGITINGVYIHPWLYWHINFWKMMVDVDPDLNAGIDRVPGQSELRDNEWLFAEFLKKAEEENKGIFMFGCRRFGKALLNSEVVYMENGEKRICDLAVGDKIFNEKGKLVSVEGVFPQGKVMTYRVVFEDGRSVVCCGDHIWRVKYNGNWHTKPLKVLLNSAIGNMYIQIPEALDYPSVKLFIPPDVCGVIVANHLLGYQSDIGIDSASMRLLLRSSIKQKRMFVESFMKAVSGVMSGEEIIELSPYANRKIVNFVHRMFWSYGWYAGMEGNKLILSSFKKELKISDVTVYGKKEATCIKVGSLSGLFLTTNYIVTHNTAIMSSYLARNATMTYNLTHNVIGASQGDLSQMTTYLEFGLDNLPPFLKINRTGNDWSKSVILGNSTVRNERDVHARISIVNIDSGKTSGALKPAGGTPYTTIYDEVGKFPVLSPYLAGLPSHMMHGKMRGMIIMSGTGGNVERSQDAQKIMNSPDDYRFIVMDYDLLNRHTIHPTWRICKSGCFVPAQMSHAFTKHETTLDKYLGVKDASGLRRIKIKVSDFDENTERIKASRNELAKKDRSLFVQEKMAYPLTTDDCFLNASVNRFPVEDILIHKNRLLEEGRPGKLVDVYQIEGKKMGWHFSDKVLASYPFQGGNIECPVVIYEDPPEEGGNFDYTYVSGCLLPGEKVLTENGWTCIENLLENDSLMDKDGHLNKLLVFMSFYRENTDCYKFHVSNSVRPIKVTHEHPLYISKNIPVSKRGYGLNEKLFHFDFVEAENIDEGNWTKFPNIYLNEKEIPEEYRLGGIEDSLEFWWFVGLWLGDGSYTSDFARLSITISKNDKWIIDRLNNFCDNILHVYHSIQEYKSCVNYYISSRNLSEWMMSSLGKYSSGKYIPEWMKYIKKEFKLSMIHGYLDSDGCVNLDKKRGYCSIEFVSINLELLEAFQHILFSLGMISGTSKMRDDGKMKIEDRIVNIKSCYRLRMGNSDSLKFRKMIESINPNINGKICKIRGKQTNLNRKGCFFSSDMKYIYFQFSKIDKFKYTGVVYNLYDEVHNYLLINMTSSNCDPYRQDKADTESLGAFYIVKRLVKINDPFAYKIVASYVSRPAISDDFCRTIETLIEAYGAKCLMENADRMFEIYLARRNKEMLLLENGEVISNKIIRAGSRQNNKLGLSPTVPNQRMLYNTVLQYCWEDVVVGYDEDGNEITEKGVYRIPDIELLDEMVAFGQGVNTDRIIAFGHALLLAKYYDDMGFMPESTTKKANDEKFKERKRWVVHGFSTRRRNPYAMPKFR